MSVKKGENSENQIIEKIVESANRNGTIGSFRKDLLDILSKQEFDVETVKEGIVDAYLDGEGEGFGNQNLQFAPGFIDACESGEISEQQLKEMLLEEEPKEKKKEEPKDNETPVKKEEAPVVKKTPVKKEEIPVEETPVEETPVEETPVEETPVEETPVEETPVEETPVEETPVEETPVEETPVEETPVEETPVEETPVEETPVEETPVEETPVVEEKESRFKKTRKKIKEGLNNLFGKKEKKKEEPKDNETPVKKEEAPVVKKTPVKKEEIPVEETPVEETPVEETPVEETPVEETPVEETPVVEEKESRFKKTRKKIKEGLNNLFGKKEKKKEGPKDKETPVEETPELTKEELQMIDNILQEVGDLKNSGVKTYTLWDGAELEIQRADAEYSEDYYVKLEEDKKITELKKFSGGDVKESLKDFLKEIILKNKNKKLLEETPVEETPVEETPVEETPVEETPVEETPVEENNPVVENTKDEIVEEKDEKGRLIGKGKYNADKKKEGMWEEYIYDHGSTYKFEISYKNGIKDGEYKEYRNGKLVTEGQYKDGLQTGERKESYPSIGRLYHTKYDNGNVIEKNVYEDGILISEYTFDSETGEEKETHYISSSIRREGTKKPGESEMIYKEYIDDECVREGEWDDEYFNFSNLDKLRKKNKKGPIGRLLQNIFSGNNKKKNNKKDTGKGKPIEGEDQPVGEDVEEKDKKGHIIGKGKYNKNGRRSGPWTIYDHLGGTTYITEATYKDGIEDGPYRYFGNGKKVQEEGQYKNGIRIGKWTEYYYDSDDVFTYRTYNDKGTIISKEEYDRIGEISEEFTYDPLTETKVETHYYLDGLIWKVTQKLNEDAEYQEIKNGETTHTGKYGDYYFNSENMEKLKTQKLFENIAKFVVKNNKLNIGEISKKFHTSYNNTMEFVKKMESLKIIKKSTNEGEYEIAVDEENLKSIFVKSREDLNNEK